MPTRGVPEYISRADELERRLRALEARLVGARSDNHDLHSQVHDLKKQNHRQRRFILDLLGEFNGDLVSVWRKHRKLLKELGYGD